MSEARDASGEDGTVKDLARAAVVPRGYQQEMLAESLHRNLVIAMDTGSGKTHIAVLRIKHETERESKKVSWFIAPTVALCEQQKDVIGGHLPVSVGLVSGASEPDQWKDSQLWRRVLADHRVMVSTPQVLLDAMRHGHIDLGRDIGLLVFDEAHHAADKHPYNMIMREFYHRLPPRNSEPILMADAGGGDMRPWVRPMVLGLTASPMFGGHIDKAFRAIETNLDSVIRAPRQHREELAQYVHRPEFKHVVYKRPPDEYLIRSPSANVRSLQAVVESLDINEDPYVTSLRSQLERLQLGQDRDRLDQKLSKTISKRDSYTHKGMRDFLRAAADICFDLGTWAADWYVSKVIERAKAATLDPLQLSSMSPWQNKEKKYLLEVLNRVRLVPVSDKPEDIMAGSSSKVHGLVKCLVDERAAAEADHELYSGIVFVTRRDAVLSLAEVLSRHPHTRDIFKVGCLLGNSDSSKRHSFLDITRELLKQSQSETLQDFRDGEKNLLVSTAVAEEGIDIQACGTVIRWDLPQNMVSWAQSRGRARRKKSTFVLMFDDSGTQQEFITKWERLEKEMMNRYHDPNRLLQEPEDNDEPDETEEEPRFFKVPSTGALLTLQSALGHIAHFCAVLPTGKHVPYFDIDPPDMPEGWHAEPHVPVLPYQGPRGCTLVLPRLLPSFLRVFTVERKYKSKSSAREHVAFNAYVELYKAGLLNEHLLPIEPEREPDLKEALQEIEKRTGTASVTPQMDPWAPPADGHPDIWWSTEISVQGLPTLRMLTRPRPGLLPGDPPADLYLGDGRVLKAGYSGIVQVRPSPEEIAAAQIYTRRLFWALHNSRLEWENVAFAYLLVPPAIDDSLWAQRRLGGPLLQGQDEAIVVNAASIGKSLSYPNDLTLVVDEGLKSHPACLFQGWRFDPLNAIEEEILRSRAKDPRKYYSEPIEYPVIVGTPLPRRKNLLVPLPDMARGNNEGQQAVFFPASTAKAIMLSSSDSTWAVFLPSILRHFAMASTAASIRETLLASETLRQIPLDIIMTAITTPLANEAVNYQRLETLGDCALKLLASISLLAEYPLWHEGYLSRKKDHSVANVRLAKVALRKELYRWMIQDRFVPRKWRPRYLFEEHLKRQEEASPSEETKKTYQLSTKMLADVVEALIGAGYLQGNFGQFQGNFALAVEVARLFDIGIPLATPAECIQRIMGRIQPLEDAYMPWHQIRVAESILGYTFTHKVLLVEALTHASQQGTEGPVSYERMEFLGDAVLDMLVTDRLYRAGAGYGPGQMHLRKSAVVNTHFLAYVCLGAGTELEAAMAGPAAGGGVAMHAEQAPVYLWQCLLHSSHAILQDQHNAFGRFKKRREGIQRALERDSVFPWAALTRLQAPKFFSDILESVLGAVFLDAEGDMDIVWDVLRKLGVITVMERIIEENVDVQHPVSRLAIWVSKQQKEIEYRFDKDKGRVTCTILIDGVEEAKATEQYRGRLSQNEVKFIAAEMAIKKLAVIPADEMLKEMEGLPNEEDDEEQVDTDAIMKDAVVDLDIAMDEL